MTWLIILWKNSIFTSFHFDEKKDPKVHRFNKAKKSYFHFRSSIISYKTLSYKKPCHQLLSKNRSYITQQEDKYLDFSNHMPTIWLSTTQLPVGIISIISIISIIRIISIISIISSGPARNSCWNLYVHSFYFIRNYFVQNMYFLGLIQIY